MLSVIWGVYAFFYTKGEEEKMATKKNKKPRSFKPEKGEWFSESDGRYHWEGINPKTGEKKKLNRKNIEDLRNRKIEILTAWENDLNSDAMDKTINEIVEEFLESIKNYKGSTRNAYSKYYRNYIMDGIGKKGINDFKYEHAKNYAEKLYFKNGLAYSTVSAICSVLRRSFNLAKTQNYLIGNNPFNDCMVEIKTAEKKVRQTEKEVIDGVKPKSAVTDKYLERHQHKERRALSIDEVKQYAEALKVYDPFFYPVFMVLFGTGIRCSELAGLQWEDIDFKNGLMHICRNLRYEDARENFDDGPRNRYTKGSTKNGKKRVIPMTQEVMDALRIQKEQTKNYNRIETCGLNNYVFLSMETGQWQGGRPYIALAVGPKLRKLPGRMERFTGKAFPKFTAHEARHTFITRLTSFGVSSDVIMYVAGHTPPGVTKAVYTHFEEENMLKRVQNEFKEYEKKYSILGGKKD